MKKIICAMLTICFIANTSYAACDFSTGITKLDNGNFEYTRDCHIRVGEIKRDLDISLLQNKKLTDAITLKDLALTKADERAQLWMDTSFKLEARIETMDKIYNRNKWLYFGLGVLATGAAIYAADRLRH